MSINSLCLVPQASWLRGRVSECVFWRIYMPSVSSGFNNNISPLCERRDPHGVGWIVSNFLSPSVLNFCLNQGQGKWDKEAKSCDHLGVIRWRKLPYLACEGGRQVQTIFTSKIEDLLPIFWLEDGDRVVFSKSKGRWMVVSRIHKMLFDFENTMLQNIRDRLVFCDWNICREQASRIIS